MEMTGGPPTMSELSFSEGTEAALRAEPLLARKLAFLAKDVHQARLDARLRVDSLIPYYSNRSEGYKVGTQTWMAASKSLLADPRAPAGLLLIAARNVLGPAIAAWEPDVLRTELEEHEGVKVPAVNYDKLFASITLTEAPLFYYDATVFANTAVSFNHDPVDVEIVQEVSPAQACWAVYEAETVLQENNLWEPEFDREPMVYVAAVLHKNGFTVAPKLLAFAQTELDHMNRGSNLKKKDVEDAWEAVPKKDLASQTFQETPEGIHLAKLAVCSMYVSAMADEYATKLKTISR